MGPNFGDEIDCGSFFDQIDDLIEFPSDNDCGDGGVAGFVADGSFVIDGCNNFPDVWSSSLPDNDPLFSATQMNSASDLSAELSVPDEDIKQLEWLSTFMEDSFSGGGLTIGKDSLLVKKGSSVHNHFQTSSPVSEIESSSSSSSSSIGKTIPLGPNYRGPQRTRSKRPRPTTFNPWPVMQLISPSSSAVGASHPPIPPGLSSEFDNFVESTPAKKLQKPTSDDQKKKKIKVTFSANPEAAPNRDPPPVRKCLHCEITKTPQWRAGPLGPKTLCNACGVRYKSGRLFPEYRPAASPTFVPSLHSNSHKKVVEMRGKVVPGPAIPTPTTAPNPLA